MDRERNRGWRLAGLMRWAMLALLLAALVPIARALGGELAVRRASAMAEASARGGAPVPLSALPRPSSPRADAMMALTFAQDATRWTAEAPARLALARRLIDRALEARPEWGQAWAVKTFIEETGAGRDTPGARIAFSRSMLYAPFLPEIAPWRIGYGLASWPLLDPATQGRVIDEAVWDARLSYPREKEMRARFRNSPLRARYEARQAQTAAKSRERRGG